jgi:hypothetical protein
MLQRKLEILKGRALTTPEHRRQDNIKMNLKLINLERGLCSSRLGYGPVPGACERGYETSDSIKGAEFID